MKGTRRKHHSHLNAPGVEPASPQTSQEEPSPLIQGPALSALWGALCRALAGEAGSRLPRRPLGTCDLLPLARPLPVQTGRWRAGLQGEG